MTLAFFIAVVASLGNGSWEASNQRGAHLSASSSRKAQGPPAPYFFKVIEESKEGRASQAAAGGGAHYDRLLGRWVKVEKESECSTYSTFNSTVAACDACHRCRQWNGCPCASYPDSNANYLFCFDERAPDFKQSGNSDQHMPSLHCNLSLPTSSTVRKPLTNITMCNKSALDN